MGRATRVRRDDLRALVRARVPRGAQAARGTATIAGGRVPRARPPRTIRAVIAVVDVHYEDDVARAACVVVDAWTSTAPRAERVILRRGVAPYVPGSFWLRELPPTLDVLAALDAPPGVIVVDGHVWLAAGAPGFGARLSDARGGAVVVGVAKSPFRGAPAVPVLRGASARPLWVSATGMDPDEAARHVRAMAGPHRIPTILGRADALSRGY